MKSSHFLCETPNRLLSSGGIVLWAGRSSKIYVSRDRERERGIEWEGELHAD